MTLPPPTFDGLSPRPRPSRRTQQMQQLHEQCKSTFTHITLVHEPAQDGAPALAVIWTDVQRRQRVPRWRGPSSQRLGEARARTNNMTGHTEERWSLRAATAQEAAVRRHTAVSSCDTTASCTL